MIVVMKEGATESQIEKASRRITGRGLSVHRSTGVHRVILGVVGDLVAAPIRALERSPGVERIVFVSEPPAYFSEDASPHGRWKGPALDIAVIGPGLIGGSLALALKRGTPHRLHAVVEHGARPSAAMKRVFSSFRHDASAALKADLVVFAAPVGASLRILERLGPSAPKGAVWTDVGSVKAEPCRQARRSLAKGAHFIGGHPMAGSEKSGFQHARPDLFEGATWALTPCSRSAAALALMKKLVRSTGARPLVLDPEEHDRILAVTSHLPQFAASALAAAALKTLKTRKGWLFAGSGIRDTTRLAGSGARIWSDVAVHNRAAIAEALESFGRELGLAAKLSPAAVSELFSKAHAARRQLFRRK